MPNRLIYQVYVGPRSKLYDFCVESVTAYCDRHEITHIVQTLPTLRIQPDPDTSGRSDGASRLGYLPIFEKENALALLEGAALNYLYGTRAYSNPFRYDQVAVIDADVWIRPGAPNIFDQLEPDDDFAAVVERDMPLTDKYFNKIRSYSHAQYDRLKDVDWDWDEDGAEFCNMGVMVMQKSLLRFLRGETPAEFLARPEFKRFVDGVGDWKWSTDQVLLNWWLRKEGAKVRFLDWRWNALYSALTPGHVEQAHFVHFFLRDHMPNKGEDVAELVKTL